ncbi:MAG: stage V sporulation protein AE [Ruminococcaceae bacterium]|nr:stage V sporulation protein AE [Oscillospiraceae bacterium]
MEIFLNLIKAFAVGGLFCVIAQIFIDKTKLTPARILVGYVVAGVIIGGLGLYKPLVDFAGGGATVPLSGFGFLISDGVRKAVDNDGFVGILTGGLSSTAGGITAAMFFGLVAALIFKSKPKNKQ